MNPEESPVVADTLSPGQEMVRAMNIGVRRALREHKRLGQSIVVWDHENQKPVEVPAAEIDVPDHDDDLLPPNPSSR